MLIYRFILCLLLSFMVFLPAIGQSQAQNDTLPDAVNKKRLLLLGSGFTVGYTGMIVGLNKAWYDNSERTSFHFFNDNREWQQVDKAGHFWGAFQQSRAGVDMLRWAGVPNRKAILYGGLLGVVLQTPIEVFDGYQADYGASVGDLVANTAGSAALVAQELAWNEVRIMPKFSFHKTKYAQLRPNVLGSNLAERALKDYNGQTYWLTVDVAAFQKEESKWPKWLGVSVGYGAEEMVYNHIETNEALGYQMRRQFYLSPDLNLHRIKTKSKLLNTTFYVLSIFKFPAPTLEYATGKGFKLHPVYF
ncbi:DUF2279 domain-containing protein [Pontibacter arcticus]|nr:DUF2279 domain-containing protein [Pontibacter arcticus]